MTSVLDGRVRSAFVRQSQVSCLTQTARVSIPRAPEAASITSKPNCARMPIRILNVAGFGLLELETGVSVSPAEEKEVVVAASGFLLS